MFSVPNKIVQEKLKLTDEREHIKKRENNLHYQVPDVPQPEKKYFTLTSRKVKTPFPFKSEGRHYAAPEQNFDQDTIWKLACILNRDFNLNFA